MYLNVRLLFLVEREFVVIKVDTADEVQIKTQIKNRTSDLHDSERYSKLIHFLDSRLPVLDFHGTLAVCHDDDFTRPCALLDEVDVLCFDADNESVDSCRE
jgi:hypothetical protein